ncbi:hypothetical protein TNCV_1968341 [Trichonephila clavipes]|nr:hypothetical protein TNCV_1968341 [Trichonephila clavipes]
MVGSEAACQLRKPKVVVRSRLESIDFQELRILDMSDQTAPPKKPSKTNQLVHGTPNLRWIDGLEDLLILKTENWITLTGRRLSWKRLPVDGVRFFRGQKGVALQLQDARVGVGSNKDADRCWCSEKRRYNGCATMRN